ncbi:response regulator transcription factor [Coralliovum pocilloporae]|uniref:response regulator transcription factor n=1 Tax=Coralliovum pocilloporae TaxID=3066369 RepID=UPI00330725F3
MVPPSEQTNPVQLTDDAPHLLVVDDDSRIRSLLHRYLGTNGFRVTEAEDAADARRKLASLSFDLLIVDVMMPGESGFSLVSSLRETLSVPILMLTARAETENRIQGLELGADDYLAKPFEPRELLLRISNILKRDGFAEKPVLDSLKFGSFVFDVKRQELSGHGVPVRLTERERELLVMLAHKIGDTVPRHELASADGAGERTVDVQINRLRRKIEADPANPRYLQTVRGIGYRLVTD